MPELVQNNGIDRGLYVGKYSGGIGRSTIKLRAINKVIPQILLLQKLFTS